MIEFIKIDTMSGIIKNLDITIIPNQHICYVNDKNYDINDEFVDKVIRIIRTWGNTDNITNVIDAQECNIIVKTKDEESLINIKGDYPENYNELFNLFEELQNE